MSESIYKISYEVLEGFMDSEVPVARLEDGAAYFLITLPDVPYTIARLQKIYDNWRDTNGPLSEYFSTRTGE